MKTTATTLLAVAGLLAGGCLSEDPRPLDDGWEDEDLDPDGVPEGTLDAGTHDSAPIDVEPLVPPTFDRVTFLAEENGDVIAHATLGDEVALTYPDGDHYELRFGADDALTVTIVDGEGELVEALIVRNAAPRHIGHVESVVEVCYPFPFLHPPIDCDFGPCPWPEDFPGDGGVEWPDCFEAGSSENSSTTHLIGAVEQVPIGKALVDTGDGVDVFDIFDTPPSFAQTARIVKAGRVFDDLEAVIPEVEPLGPKLDCWWNKRRFALAVASCIATGWACDSAKEYIDKYNECSKPKDD